MKSYASQICFSIYCLINIVCGDRVGTPVKRHAEEIYQTSSILNWTILTPSPRILSTFEVFTFESNCVDFFGKELKSFPSFSEGKLLALNFDVIDQSIDTDAMQYNLAASFTITYNGQYPNDYPDILSTIVTKENMNELIIMQHEFLDASSQSIYSAFSNTTTPILLGPTFDDDKGNILLFIILIGISSILAITSASLLYQAGYCKCSRNKREESILDIHPTLTKETEYEGDEKNENSTIGKLGATKQLESADDMLVTITPNRGIDRAYEAETPFTQNSAKTEVSNTTITSRNPLGIVKMSTLNKLLQTPQTKQNSISKALYDVALTDE